MNDNVKQALRDVAGDDMSTFVENYRQAVEDQYNADVNALNNQRNLDYTTIMSGANARGMLHSTFPTRDKLKYDVGTYEPQLIKLQQGYRTGLDKLYSNVANYYNQIKELQEKIADLNET